ncbi:DUF3105 domain-containing protein [Kitasatospora sp. NPDC051984]|uniref:DUF3105 domain-containing protein n=1 Tax=unclassified Kitasatospora TaxID=2633591 RepID=UPI003723B877
MGSAYKQPRQGSKSAQQADRRARIAELRAIEQRRERRNKILTIALSAGLVLAMVGGGTWLALDAKNKKNQQTEAAKSPIEGVKTWDNLSRTHVQTEVKYPQTPPVGGDHNPVWATCMGTVYDQPVKNENAVHSLEHGAVWVTYNGKANPDDIKALSEKVKATPYSLMSPYPDEEGTITLSAWGTQLIVDNSKDPRIDQFFTKYVQGPQTQEPGASCSSGAM